jgi:hypothetical protein
MMLSAYTLLCFDPNAVMTRTGSTTAQVISTRLGRAHIAIVVAVLMSAACATRKPAVVTPPPVAPRTSAEPLTFTATAYCTGHVTATGASVSAGVVAADPAVLPMGTVIRITGAAPMTARIASSIPARACAIITWISTLPIAPRRADSVAGRFA